MVADGRSPCSPGAARFFESLNWQVPQASRRFNRHQLPPTGESAATSDEATAALSSLRSDLAAAAADAAAARQLLAEARGARDALETRAEALERELCDARLQVEWMEGKVSDLEGGGGRRGQVGGFGF